MTKKHFVSLADLVIEHKATFTPEAIQALANWCAAQNPNFDRQRWMDYIHGKCGSSGGKRK